MTKSVKPAPLSTVGYKPEGVLALKNAIIIDGTGAPPYGPAHIIIKDNKISQIIKPNVPGTSEGEELNKPDDELGDVVIDLAGCYVMPGFVDSHGHIGSIKQIEEDEYVFKLWLAHGITTVREAGSLRNGLDFVVSESERSARNEIAAPRIEPYVVFGQDFPGGLVTTDDVVDWVANIAKRGAKGIKFFGAPPQLFKKGIEEAKKHGLRTMCHHAPSDVARVNARTTARWGLTSIEHSYGLPEAMFTDKRIQNYPADYNYVNEHHRFEHLGRLWGQSAEPGSRVWVDFIDELIELGVTLVPTFVAYLASRDVEHAMGRRYHKDFTTARMSDFYSPNDATHGSYFFDWGTEQEVAWRDNYRRWMRFVKDFHLKGGRVCVGSDAGFIYNLYGFGFVEEMELLREAGLSPLDIIRAGTLSGAELLGQEDSIGSVEPGKLADLAILDENPLANLKFLYANGHKRYTNDGQLTTAGGIKYTVKDGIIYDARQLTEAVKRMVEQERQGSSSELY